MQYFTSFCSLIFILYERQRDRSFICDLGSKNLLEKSNNKQIRKKNRKNRKQQPSQVETCIQELYLNFPSRWQRHRENHLSHQLLPSVGRIGRQLELAADPEFDPNTAVWYVSISMS